jgi:MATE family multidrug resistance protein
VSDRHPIALELGELARLSLPIAGASFGNILLSVADTIIVGRAGETSLAAIGLGNAIFFSITVLGLGLMLGLDPLIAQAIGAGEERHARALMWQGVWSACFVTVPLALLVVLASALLGFAGQDPDTLPPIREFLWGRLPSMLPFLVFAVLRSYLQAVGITRPMVIAVIVANVVNAPLCALLVFGDAALVRVGLPALGVPAFGLVGAGIASSAATFVQVAVLALALRKLPTPEGDGSVRRLDLPVARHALALGAPVGLQLLAEVGVFATATVLMGQLGKTSLAAHQVALQLASTTFMVPLGIGTAAAVRVGQAIGRGDAPGTRRAGLVAIGAGAAFMACCALLFVVAGEPLTRVFTTDENVVRAAIPLVAIAAFFQLSDGVQAVASGALRGAGDTRWPLFSNLAGHYAIGLPTSLALTFGLGWGARGLWWGLSAGLTSVALALLLRFVLLTRQAVARA